METPEIALAILKQAISDLTADVERLKKATVYRVRGESNSFLRHLDEIPHPGKDVYAATPENLLRSGGRAPVSCGCCRISVRVSYKGELEVYLCATYTGDEGVQAEARWANLILQDYLANARCKVLHG